MMHYSMHKNRVTEQLSRQSCGLLNELHMYLVRFFCREVVDFISKVALWFDSTMECMPDRVIFVSLEGDLKNKKSELRSQSSDAFCKLKRLYKISQISVKRFSISFQSIYF